MDYNVHIENDKRGERNEKTENESRGSKCNKNRYYGGDWNKRKSSTYNTKILDFRWKINLGARLYGGRCESYDLSLGDTNL